MLLPRPARAWILLSLALAGVAVAQPAKTPAPAILVLDKIEPGEFEFQDLGGTASRSECVTDPATLIQIRHPGIACSRFVIENRDRAATVHYTCPGAGHGRTTIKVAVDRVVRIESQGIADNAPFDFRMEGRRTGACPAAPPPAGSR